MKRTEDIKFREKWEKVWSVEKKIQFVILVIIMGMTLIAISVSAYFFVHAINRQNQQHTTEQLAMMTAECDANLQQYKSVMLSMVMDESVQEYCRTEDSTRANILAGSVYDMLLNMLNIQSNANFAAVVNFEHNRYVYNGNLNLAESNFENIYLDDYKKNSQIQGEDNVVFSFSNNYYRGERYTLTVYFPVYSVTQVGKKYGMLILNLDDNLLLQLQSKRTLPYSKMYLIDKEGNVVSGKSFNETDEESSYSDMLLGDSGHVMKDGKLFYYQKVGDWDYFLVDEIPVDYLYKDWVGIVGILLVSMLVIMLAALTVSRKLIARLYAPMNKVIRKMNDVSQGNLGTRIHDGDMDSDSQKLAYGFNRMMDEIDLLMQQNREEQEQMNQIKLNSLQSQIQPHFLYNTLECIHWQAASEGKGEISTMVKALAQYYRICLSGGDDMIPLERELEHVKNYLIIQNMRYGDIIELEVEIPEKYNQVKLPKITLQPLVENSIYHGIKLKEGRRGKIRIYTETEEDAFCIVVWDNGEGMTLEQIAYLNQQIQIFDKNIGYGINNVNKRIELIFGEGFGLRYYKNPEAGVSVKIRLPEREEE